MITDYFSKDELQFFLSLVKAQHNEAKINKSETRHQDGSAYQHWAEECRTCKELIVKLEDHLKIKHGRVA